MAKYTLNIFLQTYFNKIFLAIFQHYALIG